MLGKYSTAQAKGSAQSTDISAAERTPPLPKSTRYPGGDSAPGEEGFCGLDADSVMCLFHVEATSAKNHSPETVEAQEWTHQTVSSPAE